uniref:Helicase-associated domain-containing protein n=1 Tax=Pseudo-nitzschia australis TaxID=44445 RepID=A0A7S4EQH0_9STRA|mmetsp:Transcript_26764/g.58702  ORF Transcript_26764/g.58702 Transcript_26764/m.58702 type:complete len:525 (-) Transcript_26764:251-1825(-)
MVVLFVLVRSRLLHLLLVVLTAFPPLTTLAMVAEESSRQNQHERIQQLPSSKDDLKSLSPITTLQDHLRVQEMLKNRHARRKPRLEAVDSMFRTSFNDHFDEIDGRENELWLSLPRKPKKDVTQILRSRSNRKGKKLGKNSTAGSSTMRTTTSSNGLYIPFEDTLQALQAFHEEHSHLVLPRRFPVPTSSSYPSIWHGIDLAGTVYTMRWWQRHVKNQPNRVSELNRIGFIWERLQPEWNLIFESLIIYKALYGNILVPSTFVVPNDDDRWPKACWGISLGNSVYKIRNRGDYLGGINNNSHSRREQLDALGFVWDVQELRFSKFSTALELYGKIEQKQQRSSHSGALKVPSQFVIPRSSRWPTSLWGYRLGERCTQVRQKELYIKGHAHRVKILADLGFYLSGGNNNLRWLEVVHAAAVYSQMNDKKLDVPTKFVVPAPPRRVAASPKDDENERDPGPSRVVGSDDAWPWPEYLWEFPLGQRLRDIRVKGNYLKGKSGGARRKQLDALGFNWEPKRGRRLDKD